ncbi:Ribonuclease Y [bioreactor metagenome]|uniref:Ribonuclease Y n=1 Tax=bioreactor metagenome TaxID=1076179 RepID=A0A644Y797_9ZZZZ
MLKDIMPYIPYMITAVVSAIIFFFTGTMYRKKVAESEIGSAETEAKRIINEAIRSAEAKKKETTLEAKEEAIRLRAEAEKELRERRAEVTKQERRIQQKEESLDRKTESLEAKEEQLSGKMALVEKLKLEAEQIKDGQTAKLEEISGFTTEQAKEYLLTNLENEIKHDAALRIKEVEQRFKEESEQKAREIVTLAIQKYAADYVAEATVSVVALPSDEMKGRIIGREGRNIRTIETITGVDLIIDDTPEAITISSFDPVRREIARIALERLVNDGRIHPAKIEETVERARRDVEATIKQEGERATFETGVYGLHPELVRLLGKMRYRTSYGQNVLLHSIEVANIAGIMAAELGIDIAMAKRAGLLHDLGKALDHEIEGSHVQIGADVAKKYKESPIVINAIESHHGDVEPTSIIACLVQAADAVSAARPGARRENLEAYIKRLQKLEEISNSFPGVERSFAIQAGREIRIMVQPEQISDDDMPILAREIVKKIEDELEYPGQIKVNLVRESRAIDFAK